MDLKTLSQNQLIDLRVSIDEELRERRRQREDDAIEAFKTALLELYDAGVTVYVEVNADEAEAGEAVIGLNHINFHRT